MCKQQSKYGDNSGPRPAATRGLQWGVSGRGPQEAWRCKEGEEEEEESDGRGRGESSQVSLYSLLSYTPSLWVQVFLFSFNSLHIISFAFLDLLQLLSFLFHSCSPLIPSFFSKMFCPSFLLAAVSFTFFFAYSTFFPSLLFSYFFITYFIPHLILPLIIILSFFASLIHFLFSFFIFMPLLL